MLQNRPVCTQIYTAAHWGLNYNNENSAHLARSLRLRMGWTGKILCPWDSLCRYFSFTTPPEHTCTQYTHSQPAPQLPLQLFSEPHANPQTWHVKSCHCPLLQSYLQIQLCLLILTNVIHFSTMQILLSSKKALKDRTPPQKKYPSQLHVQLLIIVCLPAMKASGKAAD